MSQYVQPVPQRIWRVIKTYDLQPLELVSSVLGIGWGIWLLLPFATFSGGSFRVLGEIMPEEAWGGVFFMIGLLQLQAVTRPTPGRRGRAAMLAFVLWSLVGTTLILGNWRTPGVVPYSTFAIFNLWITLRMARWQT